MAPGSKRPWSMSEVVLDQPLLLVSDFRRRVRDPVAGVSGVAAESRVTSGSADASRVSPEFQGRETSQEGQVSLASSTGAPHDGHLRAGLTEEF
jgi:hypothetical protein